MSFVPAQRSFHSWLGVADADTFVFPKRVQVGSILSKARVQLAGAFVEGLGGIERLAGAALVIPDDLHGCGGVGMK